MSKRAAGFAVLLMALPVLFYAFSGHLFPYPSRADMPAYQAIGVLFEVGGIAILLAPRIRRGRDSRRQKAEADARDHLKDLSTVAKGDPLPVIAPLPATPGATQAQGEVTSLEEFPVDSKLGWELTRIAVGSPAKRITIYKGTVAVKSSGALNQPPKILFIHTVIDKRHMLYYIDPKHIIKVVSEKAVSYKIVFDILHSEALAQDGSLNWDDDLEMILADSTLDQYVVIAEAAPGFQFTKTLKWTMAMVGFMGLFLGLALNGTFHFVPTTIIHWVP